MKVKKIVEYQKIDSKLFELEKEIGRNQDKKNCDLLLKKSRESQSQIAALESKANVIGKEIADLKKIADLNKEKLSSLVKKSVQNLPNEEIEKASALKDKLSQNLNLLERKVAGLAENIKNILDDYKKLVNIHNAAGLKFKQHKEAYDKAVSLIDPKIKEIKSELISKEKDCDKELLEKYKKKRADRIFPVFVSLNNKSCGGCHMEIPASQISLLDKEGLLVCENCRRFIYKV